MFEWIHAYMKCDTQSNQWRPSISLRSHDSPLVIYQSVLVSCTHHITIYDDQQFFYSISENFLKFSPAFVIIFCDKFGDTSIFSLILYIRTKTSIFGKFPNVGGWVTSNPKVFIAVFWCLWWTFWPWLFLERKKQRENVGKRRGARGSGQVKFVNSFFRNLA